MTVQRPSGELPPTDLFIGVRCVLFDLDGTLADSAPDLGRAANAVRGDRGLPPLPLLDYRAVASGGARGLLGKALGITPADADFPALRDRFLEAYVETQFSQTRLFDDIAELLEALRLRGYRWGVVTNKAARFSRPLMRRLDPAGYCACMVSGDDVPNLKPAPDSIRLACEMLNLQPQAIVYLGDDRRDIVAGRSAGTYTVATAWGYLGEHPDPSSWGADRIIDQPLALLDLLPAAASTHHAAVHDPA